MSILEEYLGVIWLNIFVEFLEIVGDKCLVVVVDGKIFLRFLKFYLK